MREEPRSKVHSLDRYRVTRDAPRGPQSGRRTCQNDCRRTHNHRARQCRSYAHSTPRANALEGATGEKDYCRVETQKKDTRALGVARRPARERRRTHRAQTYVFLNAAARAGVNAEVRMADCMVTGNADLAIDRRRVAARAWMTSRVSVFHADCPKIVHKLRHT